MKTYVIPRKAWMVLTFSPLQSLLMFPGPAAQRQAVFMLARLQVLNSGDFSIQYQVIQMYPLPSKVLPAPRPQVPTTRKQQRKSSNWEHGRGGWATRDSFLALCFASFVTLSRCFTSPWLSFLLRKVLNKNSLCFMTDTHSYPNNHYNKHIMF